MPPSNRMRSSGGQPGKLASILGLVLGGIGDAGVVPNTEGAKVAGPPAPDGTPAGGMPFKANNIFAKPRAAQLNNQYTLEQLQSQDQFSNQTALNQQHLANQIAFEKFLTPEQKQRAQDAAAVQIQTKRDSIPIDVEAEQKVGAAKNANQIALRNAEVLQGRGIISNDPNMEEYNAANSGPLIQSIGSKARQDIAQSQQGEQEATQNQAIGASTFPARLAGANIQAQFANEKLGAERSNFPAVNANALKAQQYKLELDRNQALNAGITPIRPNEGLLNLNTGKLEYQDNPMQRLQSQISGQSNGVLAKPPVGGTSVTVDPNDPSIVIIGGIRHKVVP